MRQIALEQKRQLDQQGDEGRGRVVAEVEAMRLAEEARLKAEADLALVQAQVQAAVEQQQLESSPPEGLARLAGAAKEHLWHPEELCGSCSQCATGTQGG